jgi:L-ascorbate metabolism protein UlaG (beta-lactamase superfamily)
MDPRGAAQAAAMLEPDLTVPIHWGTYFPIGMRGIRGRLLEKPVAAFEHQMAELAPGLNSEVLRPGESLRRPAASS